MANDTIKGAGDVYQKDLYGDLTMSAEQALEVLLAINKALAAQTKSTNKIINIEAKDVNSLNDLNKGIEQVNESFEEKLKIDKERVKVQKKIEAAQADNIKQLVELETRSKKLSAARNELIKRQVDADKQRRKGNQEIAEAIKLTREEEDELQRLSTELLAVNQQKAITNKETKEQVKDSQGLIGAYERESKRLNVLRKRYKDLVLEEGKATKETKKLKREIDRLDKELKEVDGSAGQFQRNVGNYPDTLGRATKGILGFVAAVGGAKVSLDGVQGSLESTAEGSENVRELTSKVGGAFDQIKNVVSGAALDLFEYSGAVKKSIIAGSSLSDALSGTRDNFSRVSKATDNFTDKIAASAEAQGNLTKRIIQFEKDSRPLEVRIERLNGLIEQQQIIAGDSTRSFDRLSEAVLKGQSLQVERARILQNLAKEELEIVQEKIRIQNLSGGTGIALLDEETEAIKKLIDAENQLKNEVLENEKELRQIKQDRLEIDLDILIDGFDNQKTINERIIANEKESLATRASLLKRTSELAEESFRGQKEVLEELSAEGINLDDLLLLDATELAKQIQKLEQSEIINTRTLEVLRERKVVLQDLTEAQNDLNDASEEGLDLEDDIIAQQEALFNIVVGGRKNTDEELEKLEKKRFENQKASLERRIDLSKEDSLEELRLRKELNDLLLEEQDRLAKKEEEIQKKQIEADKKAAEKREEIQKASLGLIERSVQARSDARQEELSKELSETEKQQDRLRELADKGVLGADQSLAAEEKKQAELERQKQQEARNQELRTAGFKILSALLEQGKSPQEAIPEVGVLLGALPAVINAIPTFFEGTEDTGKVRNALDSKGGRLSMLHDNERVIDKKNNMKMGGVSNDEAANIVQDYNRGVLGNLYDYNQPKLDEAINTNWKSNQEILNKFESLENTVAKTNNDVKRAIENKPVITDVTYNKILNELLTVMESNGKKHRTISKPKRRL